MWGIVQQTSRPGRYRRPGSRWVGASAYRSRRAQRGQALVEFALIFPVILLLVVGATDVSTLLDNHLDAVYAARAGARIGSILGTAPATDCAIIGAVRASLSATRNLQLQRIVIYDASATGAPIGSESDVYAGSAVCNSDATISPPATSLGWPPSQRSVTPMFEDSIGVELDYAYTSRLGSLGLGQLTFADHAVMPLEVVIGTPVPTSGVGA
jgi:Flp pilus assembly protein TadG